MLHYAERKSALVSLLADSGCLDEDSIVFKIFPEIYICDVADIHCYFL
jgi:hypothetical protein